MERRRGENRRERILYCKQIHWGMRFLQKQRKRGIALALVVMFFFSFAAHVTPARAGLGTWPVLKKGTRGEDVFALQYLLRARGYSIVVDGIFGSGTESAVKAFQQANGLVVDGIVGSQTWSKLIITVKYGSRGDAVRAVQRLLNAKYHTSLVIDGVFGSNTKSKVKDFQSHVGISADGIVGPTTWRYLVSHFFDLTRYGSSGTGWYHYYDDGNDDWGTANVIAQLLKVARDWYYQVGSPRIGISDTSREHGGYFPPHQTHRDGLDTDIRILRNDGKEASTKWYWSSYSRSLTRLLLQMLWDTGMVSRVLFNDPTLINEGLCTYYDGHDDHLHVDWKM